eukprot:scaffold34631_cov251-Amphora_coffeaeformis.AAC.6
MPSLANGREGGSHTKHCRAALYSDMPGSTIRAMSSIPCKHSNRVVCDDGAGTTTVEETGEDVGATVVGRFDGWDVDDATGELVGNRSILLDGDCVGPCVGRNVGDCVGTNVGPFVGKNVGEEMGESVVGNCVVGVSVVGDCVMGAAVGTFVGRLVVGLRVVGVTRLVVGSKVAAVFVGANVVEEETAGTTVGVRVGESFSSTRATVGDMVGASEGLFVSGGRFSSLLLALEDDPALARVSFFFFSNARKVNVTPATTNREMPRRHNNRVRRFPMVEEETMMARSFFPDERDDPDRAIVSRLLYTPSPSWASPGELWP